MTFPVLTFLNLYLQLEPQLKVLANFQGYPNNNPNPSRLPPKEINSLLILLSDFLQAELLQEIKLVASHIIEKTRKKKLHTIIMPKRKAVKDE